MEPVFSARIAKSALEHVAVVCRIVSFATSTERALVIVIVQVGARGYVRRQLVLIDGGLLANGGS
ncbi:hypothetical protein ACS49_02850 [Bacillus cereus]|nr:hypothetical protein ACS49_02850 [Bacillus cereus]